jgi:hypothetical protein
MCVKDLHYVFIVRRLGWSNVKIPCAKLCTMSLFTCGQMDSSLAVAPTSL